MRKSVIVICLLITLLLALPLLGGCAKEEPPTPAPPTPVGKPVVKVGFLCDYTGPVGHGRYMQLVIEEGTLSCAAKYNPLPVDIEILPYDTKYDPAKGIEGYKYLAERGIKVCLGLYAQDAETIYRIAPEYKIPLMAGGPSTASLIPPGWVFSAYALYQPIYIRTLKWISENHWDYEAEGRKPKIGVSAWRRTMAVEATEGIEAYCEANPDKFEFVSAELVPVGTVSFAAEVDRLKGCDYILVVEMAAIMVPFVKEAQAKGFRGKYVIGHTIQPWFLWTESIGKEALDGTIMLSGAGGWYTDDSDGAREMMPFIDKYYPDPREKYLRTHATETSSTFPCFLPAIEAIRIAAEDVGADNITGEAIYKAFQKLDFEPKDYGMDGLSGPYKTSATERVCMNYIRIYTYSAAKDTFLPQTDWLSLEGMWPIKK